MSSLPTRIFGFNKRTRKKKNLTWKSLNIDTLKTELQLGQRGNYVKLGFPCRHSIVVLVKWYSNWRDENL